MNNEKLILFELYHKLKNFTTVSYSAKKLQDLIEAKLEDMSVTQDEIEGYMNQWLKLEIEITRSLKEIKELMTLGD